MVLTIVLLALRKTGWPVAVGTLVVCALVLFVGVIGYGDRPAERESEPLPFNNSRG